MIINFDLTLNILEVIGIIAFSASGTFKGLKKEFDIFGIGLSTLFRTIFIRSFFYILQVFYNLVIHEYECYCTNSHNQINLFLALQNF